MYIGMIVNHAVVKKAIKNPKMPMYVTDIQEGVGNACEELLKENLTLI